MPDIRAAVVVNQSPACSASPRSDRTP